MRTAYRERAGGGRRPRGNSTTTFYGVRHLRCLFVSALPRCGFAGQVCRVVVGGGGGGYGHTARGTKPAEEAAGGAVMAVRRPGSSPFTVLLQKHKRGTLKQKRALTEPCVCTVCVCTCC